jgi:hypothetical protein
MIPVEIPDLILTKETFEQYILRSQPGQLFYYKRSDTSGVFNIKFIENHMKINYNITVKYDGEHNAGKRIYKLRVLDIPNADLPDEKVEQKTIFFDPQNLL